MSRTSPFLQELPNGNHHLMVKGKPFFMRAGELHNSSMSSSTYMNRKVWPQMVANNINTVLGVVSWEDIETEEGQFDFQHLDEILEGARSHGLKLVILWFASIKNCMSLPRSPRSPE